MHKPPNLLEPVAASPSDRKASAASHGKTEEEVRARVQVKKELISPLQILGLTLILSLIAVLVCLALAFEWIPGYPRAAQKNVSIYYQAGSASAGLAAYLHPPLNSIQAEGQSQFLAFEFTNRTGFPLSLASIKLLSANCFHMDLEDPPNSLARANGSSVDGTSQAPLFTLNPSQAILLRYKLQISGNLQECPDQSPLVFLYTWQQTGAIPTANTSVEQDSISTGPVRLVTSRGLHWQRFFSLLSKTIPVMLLPVFIAAGNYVLQDLQSRKAQEQKEKEDAQKVDERETQTHFDGLQKLQQQKLEVWKIMIPSLVNAIGDHYVPIVRILALLEDEARLPPGQADLKAIIACILLFRTKITHLVDLNGGFYFRNHRAEFLCATLVNTLMSRCYRLSGDRLLFNESAERLLPVNSLTQVRQTLMIDSPEPGRFGQFLAAFMEHLAHPEILAELKCHAKLLNTVLEHEINDPFFPLWYETEQEPLNFDELRNQVRSLNLSSEGEDELSKQLEAYLTTKAIADGEWVSPLEEKVQ